MSDEGSDPGTWSEDVRSFAMSVKAAGWDPFDPSQECARETATWRGLGHLGWEDASCIHHFFIAVKLVCRFCRSNEYTKEREEFLKQLATAFLMTEIRPRVEWTTEECERLRLMIRSWWTDRQWSAHERMIEAVRQRGPDHVIENRAAFEPAFSTAMMIGQLEVFDTPGDMARARRAWAMHDENQRTPRNLRQASVFDEASLHDYHGLAIQDGRSVSVIDKHGHIVLDTTRFKRGLDAAVGPSHHPRRETPLTALGLPSTACTLSSARGSDSPEDVVDSLEAVRQIIEQRRSAAHPRSVARLILENMLRGEGQSPEELAASAGKSPQAVRKARRREIEAIRRRLGA